MNTYQGDGDLPSRLGIFWFYKDRLLMTATPLKEGIESPDAINGDQDHVHYWPVLQKKHPALRNLEYEQVPRGRVLFLKNKKKFVVYMDNVLHRPVVKNMILKGFNLPKSKTEFEFDPHYTTDPEDLDQLFNAP